MQLLKQEILKKGKILPGDVLKVDSFLNTQIDVSLMCEMGKDIYAHFSNCGVNKILTIEASGIGLACLTAQFFNCKVVYAKKSKTANMSDDVYLAKAYSYTRGVHNNIIVPKEFILKGDKILIIDDFLAHGEASAALMDVISQSGAELKGVAIAIEKGFQGAGDKMRKNGIDVYSLAIIDAMEDGKIIFRD